MSRITDLFHLYTVETYIEEMLYFKFRHKYKFLQFIEYVICYYAAECV